MKFGLDQATRHPKRMRGNVVMIWAICLSNNYLKKIDRSKNFL